MKANAIRITGTSKRGVLWSWRNIQLLAIVIGFAGRAMGGSFELLTVPEPGQAPPLGGGSDSLAPIISPDGRYVLFASLADNLVLTSNNLPIQPSFPATLNVYLRDRTNQTTTLVSINLAGTGGGNGDSLPAGLSSNAQYVLFESSASDLVPGGTNNASGVFIRDLKAGTTLLLSAGTNGTPANGASRGSVMTPDGRFVAFVSAASNLVSGDTNGIADVFVRDLQTSLTTLVSVGAISSWAISLPIPVVSTSESPDITPDGRYVAFYSTATNLVPGTVNTGDIYVRDLLGGTTTWASSYAFAAVQAASPTNSAVVAYNHVLSTNGQFVAYEASPFPLQGPGSSGVVLRYNMVSGFTDVIATNAPAGSGAPEDMRSLDMTPDGRFVAFIGKNGSATSVFVWDSQTGTTALASGELLNTVPTNSICDSPRLDPGGRHVLFLSSAANLVTNHLRGDWQVYLRDMQADTTTLVDVETNGMGPALSVASAPQMSANARFVAFECADAGLVPRDSNGAYDVFVRDTTDGTNEMISARDATLPTVTPDGASLLSAGSVSADGRYVAFASDADNLVPVDTNGWRDVFVRDLLLGSNILISVGPAGIGANMSREPAISGNGRFVAFTSSANNLVSGDVNSASDVFVRDLQAGTNVLVSVNSAATGPGNGHSYSPTISSDGRYVLFLSMATNLAPGPYHVGNSNLFLRDLQSGTTYALTHTVNSGPVGAMTPDGRFVAFYGDASFPQLYVWSSQTATQIYSKNIGGIVDIAISPDGNRIAYVGWASAILYALDRIANTNWIIADLGNPVDSLSSVAPRMHWGPRFSGDGRFVAFATKAGTNQVYVHDFQYRTNFLVSHAYNSSDAANSDSDWPEISSDGRFVAYRSLASNIVPGTGNGYPQMFLYDRANNTTTLLSASRFAGAVGDNRSLAPVFSADAQTLVFESWASDLVSQDFNQGSDLFAYRLYASGSIPLFSVAAMPGGPGQGPWLTWPVVAGRNYTVQFKNSVQDAVWQTLNGGVTIFGSQACLNDVSAGSGPRIYRVVAY